jgi:hypothetical protein
LIASSHFQGQFKITGKKVRISLSPHSNIFGDSDFGPLQLSPLRNKLLLSQLQQVSSCYWIFLQNLHQNWHATGLEKLVIIGKFGKNMGTGTRYNFPFLVPRYLVWM